MEDGNSDTEVEKLDDVIVEMKPSKQSSSGEEVMENKIIIPEVHVDSTEDIYVVKEDETIENRIIDYNENTNNNEQVGDEEEENIRTYSVDDILDKLGFGLFHIYLTIYTGSWFMTESCEVIMLSLLLPFLKEKMGIGVIQESVIGAAVFTGMGLGSYFWGHLSDRMGRRFAILVTSAFMLNFYAFTIFRFGVGFAAGGAPVPFSLYTEFLPRNFRGPLTLCIWFFWTFGAIYESVTGWIILTNDSFFRGYAWNWYVLASAIPCIINVVLLPFTPESIRYLALTKGTKEEDLKKIFGMVAKMNCCPHRLPKEPYHIVMKTESHKRRGRVLDLFKKNTFFMFVCICVFFMSGSFVYYGVALSTPDLVDSSESYSRFLGSLLLSLSEILGLIAPTMMFLCFSRNFTQGVFFGMTGLSLLMLVIPVDSFGYKVVFALYARIGIMAASCAVWVISSESLPTNVRSVGSGIGNGMAKMCTICAPFASYLFSGIGDNLIPKLIFSCVALVASFLSFCYPYESRGKGLSDLGEEVELKDLNFLKKKKKIGNHQIEEEEDKTYEILEYKSDSNSSSGTREGEEEGNNIEVIRITDGNESERE